MINGKIVSASILDLYPETIEKFTDLEIGVELSAFAHPKNLSEDVFSPLLASYKRMLKDFKHPISMHGAFYDLKMVARDPWIVDVAYRRIIQSLEIANELGVQKVVFHANYVPVPDRKYQLLWMASQIAFWEKVLPTAEKYGIQMLIENTREPKAEFINEILKHLDSPYCKTCLDTGHTNCFTKSGIAPRDWVKDYGNNLAYIHLHNNHGLQDEHLEFPNGTLDLEGFFPALEELDEYPWIILEVKTKDAFEKSYAAIKEVFKKN